MVAYSFKPQFVEPIRVGLGLPSNLDPPPKPKRHTIRANGKRRHARPGEALQLYRGMRTKQCYKIGDARCSETKLIILWFEEGSIAAQINGEMLGPRKMKAFAQADGFKDSLEMAAFWSHENGTRDGDKWEGTLICWVPIASEASP